MVKIQKNLQICIFAIYAVLLFLYSTGLAAQSATSIFEYKYYTSATSCNVKVRFAWLPIDVSNSGSGIKEYFTLPFSSQQNPHDPGTFYSYQSTPVNGVCTISSEIIGTATPNPGIWWLAVTAPQVVFALCEVKIEKGKNITSFHAALYDICRHNVTQLDPVKVPYVTNKSRSQAEQELRDAHLIPEFYGSGDIVQSQFPEAGAEVARETAVKLQLRNLTVEVPYVVNMNRSQAEQKLRDSHLIPEFYGTGDRVDSQLPEAAKVVARDTTVKLQLSPCPQGEKKCIHGQCVPQNQECPPCPSGEKKCKYGGQCVPVNEKCRSCPVGQQCCGIEMDNACIEGFGCRPDYQECPDVNPN